MESAVQPRSGPPPRRPRAWARALVACAAWLLLARAVAAQDCTYIAEGAAWLWHPSSPPADWTLPSIDDEPTRTAWTAGCAPFTSTGCGFSPGTPWTPSTTLYLRQHVWLDGGETGLVARVAIDNDFALHVNGTLVGSLGKEGCATRWDATLPVPDSLWVPGDNVVAVQIVDRGGVSNFEMTLTGPSDGTCPLGCATVPCMAGPSVVAPDVVDCEGRIVPVVAASAWAGPCPGGEIWHRFLAPDGTVLRDWGPGFSIEARVDDGATVLVEARCAHSPACPVGGAVSALVPLPHPPQDPGPALRVSKLAGLAVLDWSLAPPLGPAEHDHVWQSQWPDGGFVRVNAEGETLRSWTDPVEGGLAHYLVRVADSCEIESLDSGW